MDEKAKMESHLSSAAAFVEGGVQDACDEACSICLENFCDSDPSTVTGCKHEFHLQCILEWCQRSSQCPMCWQPISLKDPTSQELFEAVEHERNIRLNRTRTTRIFHHPALGDLELQHLPVGGTDAELEERIIQHLAAAAAMGGAHHIARREGHRGRTSFHGRPQYLVFSTHPNTPTVGTSPASSAQRLENEALPAVFATSPSSPISSPGGEIPNQETNVIPAPVDSNPTTSRVTLSGGRASAAQSTPVAQDRPGPSDFQSFSENLKSRLNAVSSRYKESITKSTRGWRERLFARNSSVADIGSEVRREVNAGIATVSRMMERLDTRERWTSGGSASANLEDHLAVGSNNAGVTGNSAIIHPDEGAASASCVATSSPN